MFKIRLLIIALFAGVHTSTLIGQQVLTLSGALEIAFQMSPDIRLARLSLVQSEENLNAQRAGLKSNFNLNVAPISYVNKREYDPRLGWSSNETTSSGGTFQIDQPIVATDGKISLVNEFSWQDSYSSYNQNAFKGYSNYTSLKLDQPIFTYNKTKMSIDRLEYAYESSALNYELKALLVEKEVTQGFYDVYLAQKNHLIAQEEYDNRLTSYEIIKNKVEAGLTAKEELFQAELDLMSSKSNLQNKEVDLANLFDTFKLLLGLSLDEDITILAEVSVNVINVELAKAVEYGLSSRMEIRQRQIDIELGLFNIIITNAMNEFKGNIGLTYGISGENADLSKVYDNPADNQQFLVDFNVPIFDWGEKKAKLRAVQAEQSSLELKYDFEKDDVVLGIRQVHRSLGNLLNQIEIAKKNEENAQLTYDINLEKYKNGDLTSMDLNLVQNQLTQKKQAYTYALIRYKIELLNLKIQTLYDFEHNVSIVPKVENVSSVKSKK